MKFEITQITAEDTYPLRHALLRKGRPLSSCILEGDDAPETIHLGVFFENDLIGIGSAFFKPLSSVSRQNRSSIKSYSSSP